MITIDDKIIKTNKLIGFFRIHRTKEIREIGFGTGDRMETYNFCRHLRKLKLIGAKTTRYSGLVAAQLRARNKGYPKGFITHRTHDPKRENKFPGTSGHYSHYVSEVKLPASIA